MDRRAAEQHGPNANTKQATTAHTAAGQNGKFYVLVFRSNELSKPCSVGWLGELKNLISISSVTVKFLLLSNALYHKVLSMA